MACPANLCSTTCSAAQRWRRKVGPHIRIVRPYGNDGRRPMSPLPAATVIASAPTYELHSLGWKAFQQLCVSVAADVWGQTDQGFFDSQDGGRDGAFYGNWTS